MINQFRKKSAFTLIELLVVVAIIALLIAILLPSLAQAKRQAQVAACSSNLRTVGHAMAYYCQANKDILPVPGAVGFENLYIYLQKISKSTKQLKVSPYSSGGTLAEVPFYLCPGDEYYHTTNQVLQKMPDGEEIQLTYALSYSMNTYLTRGYSGRKVNKLTDLKRPSEFVSYYGAGDDDHGGWGRWCLNESNQYYNQTQFEVHHKIGNNFLYCDSHVEFDKVLMKPHQYGLPPWPWAWWPSYIRGTDPDYDDWERRPPIAYIKSKDDWSN